MNTSADRRIFSAVSEYYASKIAEHGPISRGVDWNDQTSHDLRHGQFLYLIGQLTGASVLDLGCGFGDFFRFLRSRGYGGCFSGYDVVPEMIEAAVRLHGEAPDRRWQIGVDPDGSADFAIASGIFNVKGTSIMSDDWAKYVGRTIDMLARLGRLGFAFNALTLPDSPERQRKDLNYMDPVKMLDYCLNRFGRSVALLQDYGLYEFTMIVRRN